MNSNFDWFKTSKHLVGAIGAFSGMALVPTLFFAWNFRNQELSKHIADWGAYGDYYGGILNPMIAFFSLILLATITWILGKQSLKEATEGNIQIKRMDAFDIIAKKTQSIESFSNAIYHFALCIDSFKKLSDNEGNIIFELRKDIPKLDASLELLTNCKIMYESMGFQYNHLFEYDFTSEKFLKIIISVRDLLSKGVAITTTAKSLSLSSSQDSALLEKLTKNGQEFIEKRSDFYDDYMKMVSELKNDLV